MKTSERIFDLIAKLPPTSILGLTISSLASLDAEVCRARCKHKSNALLYEVLLEEVCELINAALAGASKEEINAEAIQVACVALRIYEEGSAIEAREMLHSISAKEDQLRDYLRSRGTPD
ncbi:hypothetical protein dsx2_2519 [Desulfovibrio sp. X2]|uniref:hypothetical protein n=1 Tax=Desulfovibrio sp. X2 TaxID=941449 RepID=UPI000358D0F4|nr:hypothetical protein [Desulfovibrio sp. X2]EPR43159.1 hypothetical protein dsx2_2519 [Desulfovibrio sp. X2]